MSPLGLQTLFYRTLRLQTGIRDAKRAFALAAEETAAIATAAVLTPPLSTVVLHLIRNDTKN